MTKKVLRGALLDAGAQLEKVIVRRVLEQGYEIDKFPVDVDFEKIKDYDFFIISGGPGSVNADPLPNSQIYESGIPILGICYGMQAIAHQLGGRVERGKTGQYGRAYAEIIKGSKIFDSFEPKERVLMSHFDVVAEAPYGFEVCATSDGMVAAMTNMSEENFFKKIYRGVHRKIFSKKEIKSKIVATQFHPELVPITKHGEEIFENFFRNVCGFPGAEEKTIESYINDSKDYVAETLGDDKHVLWFLSGGVDSTVGVKLTSEVIEPERLHVRYLDTGVMREGETEEVIRIAKELGLKDFKVLDVKDKFYDSKREIETKEGSVLAGPLYSEIDPEVKRKIFGTEYANIAIDEIDELSKKLGISKEDLLFGQGTLRPDLIESGHSTATKGDADTIKTHHNAVKILDSIPKLEPLTELFKDQVRKMALALGLSEKIAYRQPSPGQSFYCRIIGSDGQFDIDEAFMDLAERVKREAKKYGFDAVPLPVKTVGVQGDERSYKYPVLLTGEINWDKYLEASLALPNKIPEINRVLFSINETPTLEEATSVTKTYNTYDVVKQIREADSIMREVAEEYGYNDSRNCSQMPGILMPVNFGKEGSRSFVIRPVYTKDFMALIGMMPHDNMAALSPENRLEFFPEDMFLKMAGRITKEVEGIERVILDSTDKPPGSTEWE